MQKYEVGSILFLIPESSFMSVPVQVVEEVIRKSISGETIDHYVAIPGQEDRALLRDIKAEIFEDIIDVRQYLLRVAETKIEKIISQTQELVDDSFDVIEKPKRSKRKTSSNSKKNANKTQIELANGQKANIVMNDEAREILS